MSRTTVSTPVRPSNADTTQTYDDLDIAKAIIHMHGLTLRHEAVLEADGVDYGWDVVEILSDGPSVVEINNAERTHWGIYSNIEYEMTTIQQAMSVSDAYLSAAHLLADLNKALS